MGLRARHVFGETALFWWPRRAWSCPQDRLLALRNSVCQDSSPEKDQGHAGQLGKSEDVGGIPSSPQGLLLLRSLERPHYSEPVCSL